MKSEFSPAIRSSQADFFKNFFIDHVDTSYRNAFIILMELIKTSDDGVITRGQLNAALYPNSTKKESIKAQLMALKRALAGAGEKRGYRLDLITPRGPGNDTQKIRLTTNAPFETPVPGSTLATTNFMARQQHKNVPAQGVDLTCNLVFVSYFGNDQELVEDFITRVEDSLQGKIDETARSIRFWLFRRTNGDNGIDPGENDHDTIQRAITQARIGVLMVSPRACGRTYIKKDEWPRFRNEEGTILKPFLPVMLSAIDEKEDDLGVLRRIGKNRPQFFDLQGRGWDECQNNAGLAAEFVEKFIKQLRKKLAESQDDSLLPQKEAKKPVPSFVHLGSATCDELKNRNVPALAHATNLK